MKVRLNKGMNMKHNIIIHTKEDYNAVSLKAYEILTKKIREYPTGAFGFATGSTPIGLYKELKKNASELDMTKITAFSLDEYYPIKQSNPQSYAYFMNTNLYDAINLPPENRNYPNGEAENALAECRRYDEKIAQSGGIKLQILGLGLNGHIGFNEPSNIDFSRCSNYTKLADETINANSRFFENTDDMPKYAITMGIRTIMMAEEILLIVTGGMKAKILKEALKGSITPLVPASALQLHRCVHVVLDQEAGKLL